jgi:ADP-ribosylglycohydrolase
LTTIPPDYEERVYAGVLGKIIGVYLGRPFEQWTYDRITAGIGEEVHYYVHERLGQPLVVTDDDISGTFTFLRALRDHGCTHDLTAAQVGEAWLNHVVPMRTTFWWGGMGNSTEHTAYVRLLAGVPAPESGSAARNTKVVAEQIGAQIFIDGWGLVCPGDPEKAAALAAKAASVSHDGEAVYAAQVVAALVAGAFAERDMNRLLDAALAQIPPGSVIARLAVDVREWHAARPDDWRATREKIEARYGYDRYGGNCHVVPNHALILHALLHGDGDFSRSLMIVNTCGWDTDCNSGNVGCLLGVRSGLVGLEDGPDWRGPVADRLYVPSADGGRAITDAVREAYEIAALGRTLAGQEPPPAPKDGARFHFTPPGSVQGFAPEDSPECRGVATVENADGGRLAVRFRHLAAGRRARVATPTFITPEELPRGGYRLVASPTLYPGQTVRASVAADPANGRAVTCRVYARHYTGADQLTDLFGPAVRLEPGAAHEFAWRVPETDGQPIAFVGVEVTSEARGDGAVYLDWLTWDGVPDVTLRRPEGADGGSGYADPGAGGTAWRRAWVQAVDRHDTFVEPFRLLQERGTGLLMQGTREWTDYRVRAAVTPHMAVSAGLAARFQGMRRWYALLLTDGGRTARLVKAFDGARITLAEAPFTWEVGRAYTLELEVIGARLRASIDGAALFDVTDAERPLLDGAIALVCEEGRMAAESVTVSPAGRAA